MSDQEIINAIDAEIAEEESILAEYRDEGCEPTMMVGYHKGYIEGLAFAKALVENQRVTITNPYQPPSPSEPSLEDRIERLEAKLDGGKPAGPTDLLLSAFAILAMILTGAMLFDVLTRAGR